MPKSDLNCSELAAFHETFPLSMSSEYKHAVACCTSRHFSNMVPHQFSNGSRKSTWDLGLGIGTTLGKSDGNDPLCSLTKSHKRSHCGSPHGSLLRCNREYPHLKARCVCSCGQSEFTERLTRSWWAWNPHSGEGLLHAILRMRLVLFQLIAPSTKKAS